ncbi:hypothetical protein MHBO_001049 [Bonamia ostreae]|uniref:Uncharacterized protein n=1 Tax=Bonamia ostreae TaxID=126728 RepID=A0ABV2AHN4_9EUKA
MSRSKAELTDPKKMARALSQFEVIEAYWNDESVLLEDRKKGFWTGMWTTGSRWQRSESLAKAHLRLGFYWNALTVFERFEDWKPVATCLLHANRLADVEEVANREIKRGNKEHELLLFLGHATAQPHFYEQCWEASEFRCSEAKRCLGHIEFKNENVSLQTFCQNEKYFLNFASSKISGKRRWSIMKKR